MRSSTMIFEEKRLETARSLSLRVYCDKTRMTSKQGKNKEIVYEPQASSVTDVLTKL